MKNVFQNIFSDYYRIEIFAGSFNILFHAYTPLTSRNHLTPIITG